MFDFLKSKKAKLQSKILKEKKKLFIDLKSRIFNAVNNLGDFDEVKIINQEYKDKLTNDEKKEIDILTKKWKINYLINVFNKELKISNFDKCDSVLADIHVLSEQYFKKFNSLLQTAKNKKKHQDEKKNKKHMKFKELFFNFIKKSKKNLQQSPIKTMKTLLKKKKKKDIFNMTEELLNKSVQTDSLLKEDKILKQQEKANIFEVHEKESDIFDSILKDDDKISEIEKKNGFKKVVEKTIEQDSLQPLQNSQQDKTENEKKKLKILLPYVGHSIIFMVFSIVFCLCIWFFFFVMLNENNLILGNATYLNKNNLYAEREEVVSEERILKKEISNFEKKISKILEEQNLQSKVVLNEIITKKTNWICLWQNLEDATKQAFQYNDILHYITYSNFQGNSDNNEITVQGKVTDPSGRVFFLLSKLVSSINNHEYFEGAKNNNFTRIEDSEFKNTFSTNFSFTLKYIENGGKHCNNLL